MNPVTTSSMQTATEIKAAVDSFKKSFDEFKAANAEQGTEIAQLRQKSLDQQKQLAERDATIQSQEQKIQELTGKSDIVVDQQDKQPDLAKELEQKLTLVSQQHIALKSTTTQYQNLLQEASEHLKTVKKQIQEITQTFKQQQQQQQQEICQAVERTVKQTQEKDQQIILLQQQLQEVSEQLKTVKEQQQQEMTEMQNLFSQMNKDEMSTSDMEFKQLQNQEGNNDNPAKQFDRINQLNKLKLAKQANKIEKLQLRLEEQAKTIEELQLQRQANLQDQTIAESRDQQENLKLSSVAEPNLAVSSPSMDGSLNFLDSHSNVQ